jgi:hypothetical protein
MGMRDYENLKDLVIPEEREKIMDIYCAAWDDCRNMGHCKDCPDRQMLKEKFSLLECFSLKYSRMLIEAGYAPVVHARWEPYQTPIETRQSGWICTNCSSVQKDLSNGDTEYCPHCGAIMDGGEQDG